jgi:hypothetical protein
MCLRTEARKQQSREDGYDSYNQTYLGLISGWLLPSCVTLGKLVNLF